MPEDTAQRRPASPRMPTRLEMPEEIRAAIQAREAELLANAPTTAAGPPPLPNAAAPVAHAPGSPASVRMFKPTLRPPVARLIVMDDGGEEGETIRIRGGQFVIGRSEGDLQLPNDDQISGRHAELSRQRDDDGRWTWLLKDLGSTNGTFVRVAAAILKDGQELLIGRTRYRFDAGSVSESPGSSESSGAANSADATSPPAKPARSTVTWNSSSGQFPLPSLVELLPSGSGARVPLAKTEHWLGSDRKACDIVPTDDPFISPRHARLTCDSKGRWHINNNKSLNGVWLRIDEIEVPSSCHFQLGEQRFSFKVQ